LRICLIGPAYPYRGGISHYNSCLAMELRGRHTVHLVNYKRLYPEFLFPGKTQYDESESPLDIESERLIDSINPFTWVVAGFHIARFDPDLTIVQWWHPYFGPAISKICSILRLLRKGRIIFVCHNVVPHERSGPDRILSKLAFMTGNGFVVQSARDRDDLKDLRSSARVVTHPHPIYDFFRKNDLSRGQAREILGIEESRVILFFGYIRPYKGLKYLLDAMPRIASESGARLLVVLPYISATQSGIAQIALAFDRPVIVTEVGGLPEVVSEGRTGFTVPPADSDGIAAAVVKFFREDWGSRMAPCFEREKQRFSWSKMADVIEDLYRRI